MTPVSTGIDVTERRIAWELVRHGPMSRADLGRALGLSAPSVTRLVRPLLAQGVLQQTEGQRGGVGRPTQPLDLVADRASVIGIRQAGHELSTVVTDLKGGVLGQRRITADLSTPQTSVVAITELVQSWQQDPSLPPVAALGVCLRARVDAEGVVRCDAPPSQDGDLADWMQVPCRDLLEEATGLPTSVVNDVHALALGEHWLGAGRGLTDLAIMVLDERVGFALVANDDLIWGHQGGSGRVRDIRLPDHRRVVDVLALNTLFDRVLAVSSQRATTVEEVVALARVDQGVADLVDEYVEALGQWASTIAVTTHPQRLVIRGEGVGLVAGRDAELQAALDQLISPCLEPVEVHLASLDTQAWARGAAVVGIRRLVRT